MTSPEKLILLNNKDKYSFIFIKVLLATFATLFSSASLTFKICTDLELGKNIIQYILMFSSLIITFLSAYAGVLQA